MEKAPIKKQQLVENLSKGYSYKYASLGDIAKQNFNIPKMKTQCEPLGDKLVEYVYYYDEVLNDWIQGARVVIPELKQGNEAQKYGAAITYARRITTLLALGLATDDDVQVEVQEQYDPNKDTGEVLRENQKEIISKWDSQTIISMLNYFGIHNIDDMTYEMGRVAISLIGKQNG